MVQSNDNLLRKGDASGSAADLKPSKSYLSMAMDFFTTGVGSAAAGSLSSEEEDDLEDGDETEEIEDIGGTIKRGENFPPSRQKRKKKQSIVSMKTSESAKK